jgi:hypothetical protein
VEQGVVRLRHKSEKARLSVQVEAGVGEERHGRAEGPREADFERCVGVVVYAKVRDAWAEDRWCQVKCGEDACAVEGRGREGEVDGWNSQLALCAVVARAVDGGGGGGRCGDVGSSGRSYGV